MLNPPDARARGDAKRRGLLFAVVLGAAITVAVLYVARAAHETQPAPVVDALPVATPPLTLATVRARPHVMFLATDLAPEKHIAVSPLDDLSVRLDTGLVCERFHFQRGAGIALGGPRAPGGVWVFDAELKYVRAISVSGVPSRARVSPDGTRAGFTFFVSGDSYKIDGFSTRAYLLDLVDSAARPVDLEYSALWRGETRVDAPDLNYWGITFPRTGPEYFATVATNDQRFLVRGSSLSKDVHVAHADVECPSLSPDGKRIAFKRRIRGENGIEWRLAVLDLGLDDVRDLTLETRNVDDQVEWLDDGHLLYAVRPATPAATRATDVWSLAVDTATPPVLFAHDALSPVVVRP